ncbi:DNA polymerase III subunit chi [Rickettsiella massiliensis]|uniref:DNA polymerase III subunit chi n=1 Tax=Rickettsiella massiliensis TaxID=676517 RepID=UPI00029A825B|nr:DNA polymerase III subunit chi [Rickettsiella massiliensis]
MRPTIDFYVLNTIQRDTMYRFLCRLVDKAWQQPHSVHIHVSSNEEAQRLDDLLWTFRDISFIPHQWMQTTDRLEHWVPGSLIFIQRSPDFFTLCSRVIEIVSDEPTEKAQGREKYKYYKTQDYPITTHTIATP